MPNSTAKVLFIDDDADVRKTAELLLRKAGYAFFDAATPEEGISRLVADPVDVVLLDLNFARTQTSGEEGLACLTDILRHDPKSRVIVVTGFSGLNVAVRAMRLGAQDVIMKPWNNERLITAIEEALSASRPFNDLLADPSILIGASEAVQRIKDTIDRFAPLSAPVFLTGERGTGKTLAATALHSRSGRTALVTREASTATATDFADCSDTTLLLENVERLPGACVPDLLNWLRAAPRRNSRLVSTSARPRSDLGLERGLTYAVATLDLVMPPLASRPDDILLLADHFARIACQQNGLPGKTFDATAKATLCAQPWKDNVHALRYVVERSVLMCAERVLKANDLFFEEDQGNLSPMVKPSLADSEKTIIEDALKRNNFNVSAAAIELGLTRPALYRRMSKHGL